VMCLQRSLERECVRMPASVYVLPVPGDQ